MICSRCGREITDVSNFCSFCGARRSSSTSGRRLTRSTADSKIAGICGGLAEYFDVDPTLIRVIWVALSIVPGGIAGGALAYLLAWLIIPKPVEMPVPGRAPIEQTAK